jgi:Raf kinase inhibitor-like YbhB/YbcL family protein
MSDGRFDLLPLYGGIIMTFRPTAIGTIAATLFITSPAFSFELSSPDIRQGATLNAAQVGNAFGCKGGGVSPAISWKDAPAGTKSFAVSLYDPDAPTGSGWWHWTVFDIPATANSLSEGAGTEDGKSLPAGTKQGHNDAGISAFMGVCPPPGPAHRYILTVTALKVEHLGLPPNAGGAMIGFMTKVNALESISITATYGQ